eukprot:gene16749-biopygen2267
MSQIVGLQGLWGRRFRAEHGVGEVNECQWGMVADPVAVHSPILGRLGRLRSHDNLRSDALFVQFVSLAEGSRARITTPLHPWRTGFAFLHIEHPVNKVGGNSHDWASLLLSLDVAHRRVCLDIRCIHHAGAATCSLQAGAHGW